MTSTTRISIVTREPWSRYRDKASTAVGPAWADTLANLARSHQARLTAPDPSRPWLNERRRDLVEG